MAGASYPRKTINFAVACRIKYFLHVLHCNEIKARRFLLPYTHVNAVVSFAFFYQQLKRLVVFVFILSQGMLNVASSIRKGLWAAAITATDG